MAVRKAKRSAHPTQLTKAARRNNRRATSRHPDRRQSAERSSPKPGSFALLEKNLPGRRFVEFPQVKGKTIEKVEMFTTGEYHCITLDLQDHTTLNLGIEPGFTINAELQQIEKGEVRVLAEWPPIKSSNYE